MAKVELVRMPLIAGLLFRPYQGESDIPQMFAVRAKVAEWDKIDPFSAREYVPTLESLQKEWADKPVGYQNSIFAEVNSQLVGYIELFWWNEEDGTTVYLTDGWVLPEWRGKGIGWTLLTWAENRAREMVMNLPDPKKAVLAANVSSTEHDKTKLMLDEDYKVVRRLSDMACDDLDHLPEISLPPGLEVRPPLPEHYPAIYAAMKEAFAGQWGTTETSEADYQEFLNDNVNFKSFDPALWKIAWAGDEVAGLVLSARRGNLPLGIASVIGVRPAWRRQGLAQALLVGSLLVMHEKGLTQARLYTNADNHIGARTLYERVGFRELKQHLLYRRPF